MTYTYNRKGITRKVLSEIVRGLGAKDELKILKSCAYLVRYALRARRATKALRCFTILTLTLFLRCIFQIPPCVNRKIVATRNARGMSARRVITMSVLFRHIYKATAPPARVNLWVGGWLPARVGLC